MNPQEILAIEIQINQLKQSNLFEAARLLEERLKIIRYDKVNVELNKFITQHPEMLKLKEFTRKLANLNYPVLILGETGTGKEILARALHGNRLGAFCPVNCAGIPEHLIESQLFGHKKGAFTGAATDKEGLCKFAENGTIFLDEIGDMPIGLQPNLLRAIQESKIRPVGSNEEMAINCRFICATHRDIDYLVDNDKFRKDLYYRISTFILKPTPLVNRRLDIPLIVKSLDKENKIKDIEEFVDKLTTSHLEGNVRSLEQYVLRYSVLGEI